MRSLQAAVALPARWPAGAAAVAATLALVAAGAVDVASRHAVTPPRAEPAARPGVALIGGLPIQQARCAQWNAGGTAERDAVVGAIAASVGGPSTSGGRGATLTAGAAQALFTDACASPIAKGFLLYELYIRAAGFSSLGGQT